MKVIHISAECFPIAKVGGLADVVGALPIYQNELNCSSKVIMPYYSNDFTKNSEFENIYESDLKLGDMTCEFQVLKIRSDMGFPLFLVKIPDLLDLEKVYGYENDTERFLTFQIAALDWILQLNIKPDIIHCHDHHTGLIPFMMSHSKKYNFLKNIPSILTIHNAQYHGKFDFDKLNLIPVFDLSKIGLLDWDGFINPLATAIKCAWRVTTVSPNYMEELKVSAKGLEGLIDHESDKCCGIVNGIDLNVWNPETDDYIIEKYSEKTVEL